jgi:hypothetical protein
MMNFSVDKKNKKIKIAREFFAPMAQVWEAFTESQFSIDGQPLNLGKLEPKQWILQKRDVGCM